MRNYEDAVKALNGALLRKQAGIIGDIYAGIPAQTALSLVPVAGSAVNAGADLAGIIHGATAPTSEKDLDEMNKAWGKSFIPGVGRSRVIRKMRHNAKGSKQGTFNLLGELIGPGTAMLTPAVIGALLGGGIGAASEPESNNAGTRLMNGATGAGIGGLAGLGLGGIATIAGALAAAAVERRTKEQQRAHDDESHAANWLIPGVGVYNYWKRIGRIKAEEDAREPLINAEKAREVADALKTIKAQLK